MQTYITKTLSGDKREKKEETFSLFIDLQTDSQWVLGVFTEGWNTFFMEAAIYFQQ